MSLFPAVTRPNGKVYRPRKIIAYPAVDYDDNVISIVVLGTHDIVRAQELANDCAYTWVDGGHVAVDPELGWYREGYEYGRRVWVRDEVHGRAGVYFREIVEES